MNRYLGHLVLVSIFLFGCKSIQPTSILPQSLFGGFKLRPYKEVSLSNGMKVLLVEDKALPYITYNMLIYAGGAQDPKDFPGLTNFVGEMIDKGTQKHSATEIADILGQIGADFDVNTDYDFTQINASSISKYANELLDIYSELITQVAFSEPEIQRLKRQTLDAIKKSTEEPESFTSMAFQDYLYSSHPYAHSVMGKKRGIAAIKKKNIMRQYLQYYRPNNAILSVVGNFDNDIVEKLEKSFSLWKSKEQSMATSSSLPGMQGRNVRVVDKSDLVQTQIRIGHYGIKRNNPDFQKLRIANTILGGGFSSRLMQEIRVRSGLTYGINSGFDARKDFGPFTVSTFTRNDKVGITVRKTLEELEKFYSQGVTDKEVTDAKAFLIGNFPKAIETAEKFAANLMLLRLHGIDDDYLTDFIKNVERITTADVNDAIKKYLNPKDLRILIFANAKSVHSQLEQIGPIETKSFREYLQ